MKKINLSFLMLVVFGMMVVPALTSCKKTYVVKPEDIQQYLDNGNDLTIILPEGSSFDLTDLDGVPTDPCGESMTPKGSQVPEPADSTAKGGGNGDQKFRHAGAFVQQAFAAEGAYHCPSVCQIIIRAGQ